MTVLVARRGSVTQSPRRGSIISTTPLWHRTEDGTFYLDATDKPVIVLWVSHWGRQVTVLTADGDHVDLTCNSGQGWLVFGRTTEPRGIPVPDGFGRNYYIKDVAPGDRFVHHSLYSGPASNFRCDVVCEIADVTDTHVSYITLPHLNDADQDIARRYAHRVERLGFGTAFCHPDDHAIGAWLPRADDPWPYSDVWAAGDLRSAA